MLAIVVPLQTSWASMRFCEGMGNPVAAVAAHLDAGWAVEVTHLAETYKASNEGAADQASAGCCDAAHGCHGLHSIALHAVNDVAMESASLSFKPCDVLIEPGRAHARLERPNWSAA